MTTTQDIRADFSRAASTPQARAEIRAQLIAMASRQLTEVFDSFVGGANQPGGYAGLGGDGFIIPGVLGSGTPSAQTYLDGAQTWRSAEQFIRTGSDVGNSTTTLADVTDLAVPVQANFAFWFSALIIFRSAATTTGLTLAATGPASPDNFVMAIRIADSLTSFATGMTRAYDVGVTSTGVDTANVDCIAVLEGLFRNGVNPGLFQVRFASEVGASAVTVKLGSTLRAQQIG
jgi:hypothetical protein